MNKHLSCALAAIACGAVVGIGAQAPAPQSSPQPRAAAERVGASATAARYIVLGCVSRETPAGNGAAAPPKFLITDNRGAKPVVYRLDGDASELTFHVGHTVEISGPLTAPPASGTGPNADALVLKVSTLTYLATTCTSVSRRPPE